MAAPLVINPPADRGCPEACWKLSWSAANGVSKTNIEPVKELLNAVKHTREEAKYTLNAVLYGSLYKICKITVCPFRQSLAKFQRKECLHRFAALLDGSGGHGHTFSLV